jgi:oligosaccharyltransferase complex subunit alpha (ribophorin I)
MGTDPISDSHQMYLLLQRTDMKLLFAYFLSIVLYIGDCSLVINNVYTDVVFYQSPVLRSESWIQVAVDQNDETIVDSFDLFFPHEIYNNICYLGVFGDSGTSLSWSNRQILNEDGNIIIRYKLDNHLSPGESAGIRVVAVYKGMSKPLPETIKQGLPQLYRVVYPAVLFTRYNVLEQLVVVHINSDSVHSFNGPEDSMVQKLENQIRFGPFMNVSPFSDNNIQIQYEEIVPRIVILNYERRLTLSHWSGKILVEENYDIINDAPRLSNGFSRIDYGHSFYHNNRVYPLTGITMSIPKESEAISYRDEVGNISTSNYHLDDTHGRLELGTRFPLFGGWQSRLEISYRVPNHLNMTRIGQKHRISGTLISPFDDVLINNFTFQIIFPEGAKDLDIQFPFEGETSISRRYSYLDTIGRPIVQFNRWNMVQEHYGYFSAEYTYSLLEMWKKVLILITVIFSIMIVYILYTRMRSKIEVKQPRR